MKEFQNNNINFYVGKNAKENWEMLNKFKQNHIWFHLANFSSPYVIMDSDDISKINLIFGANLCKENSSYKNFKKIKIIYCCLKQLKKGSKIGEVIISGKKNYLLV